MQLSYGSLFAGAGGADLGFDRAGLKLAWQVEIDKQARGVLNYRWPDVPKLHDIHDVGKHNLSPVDVIIGGSPCTSFSVAGKREGIEGKSGLFTEMVRVVDELQPRYTVWENVPGVFSGFDQGDNDARRTLADWAERRDIEVHAGDDLRLWWLGAVLRSFADIGYAGSFRICDAQFFGVPQRRRRIFGVFAREIGGCPRTAAQRTAEILALAEGVLGNPAPGRQTREIVAGSLGRGTPSGRNAGTNRERAGMDDGRRVGASVDGGRGTGGVIASLRTSPYSDNDGDETKLIPTGVEDWPISPSVTAKWAKGSGGPAGDECQNLVPTVYAIQEGAIHENLNIGPQGKGYQPDLAYTLEARHHVQSVAGTLNAGAHPGSYNGQDAYNDLLIPTVACTLPASDGGVSSGMHPIIAFSSKDSGADAGELSPTLRAMGHDGSHANAGGQVAIAWDDRNQASGSIHHTLRSEGGGSRVSDFVATAFQQNQRDEVREMEFCGALAAEPGMKQQNYIAIRTAQTSSNGCGIDESGTSYTLDGANGQAVGNVMGVRRLMPIECERLQGWKDGHTKFGTDDNGITKENADGPRYKMIGNGVAEPCAYWIADRLRRVAEHDPC